MLSLKCCVVSHPVFFFPLVVYSSSNKLASENCILSFPGVALIEDEIFDFDLPDSPDRFDISLSLVLDPVP